MTAKTALTHSVARIKIISLPAGYHGNLPVLNLLSASVAKNQHFRPCRKNYALERKMIPTI